ncbi:DNA-directed RNA polymerase subunit alpha [subsurface metagenome]
MGKKRVSRKASINELNLPMRIKNVLKRSDIEVVGQLLKMNPAQLLCIKRFGRIALRQVIVALQEIGFELKPLPLRYIRD